MPNETTNTPAVVATSAPSVLSRDEIMIGVNTDVSKLSLEDRVQMLQRLTEAQASVTPDDKLLNKDLVVRNLTIFQRDYIDPETNEVGLATYTAFEVDGIGTFKTASSQATPFALQVARLLGYDPKTGDLPNPIVMRIIPQKATTGFIYRFVFVGLAPATPAPQADGAKASV